MLYILLTKMKILTIIWVEKNKIGGTLDGNYQQRRYFKGTDCI